jgi:hypothetical protein
MASSSTEICNMALSHLKVGKTIANLTTENSEEARVCRTFYETALKETLRDFPWPFATRIAELELVEEDPNTEWAYSYRYPSTCLNFIRILSGVRNDTLDSTVKYFISSDDDGLLIFTNQEDAVAEYTVYISDVLRFAPDFTIAFSYLIASYIAPRVTGGDAFKLGDKALQLYQFKIGKAKANAANEEQRDEQPDSEFIRGR